METPNSVSVCTKQERIAQLAKQMRGVALRTLAHYIDMDWMTEAYRRTRKDGAPGVDGQTADQYAKELAGNLQSLLDRAKSGDHYKAPPVRRVYIPKDDGRRRRPIGIPTFEDKVLQRAVVMVLEPLYEQDFLDCSYGFRPGRNAHQAIETLRTQLMEMKGGWIVEADIESFYDSVDHGLLRQMLRRRVNDGVLLRLIGKWLKAGVMEEGCVYHPETGTPQGGVISPLLANIFLHEVLDVWFDQQVKPRLHGRAYLVRYADDIAIAFELEGDAHRVLEVLPKRFRKYGLRLHPDKTRLVKFRRPLYHANSKRDDDERPGSFNLLGFTHFWGRSQRGNWVIKQTTMKDRFSRTLRRFSEWCDEHRHWPVSKQHQILCQKLRGHDAYYGVTGNKRRLSQLRHWLERIWFKWLRRRSWGAASKDWTWMKRLLASFPLPAPCIYHNAPFRSAKA